METIKKWAQILFIAAVVLPVFWRDFPTMAFLYAIVTGASLAMGLGCLLGPGTAAAWERRGVDRAVQRRWSRVQGALFLVNAAICPAGWLLARFAEFDTDFILLAQYAGFVIAAAAGAAPLARGRSGETEES